MAAVDLADEIVQGCVKASVPHVQTMCRRSWEAEPPFFTTMGEMIQARKQVDSPHMSPLFGYPIPYTGNAAAVKTGFDATVII